VPLDFHSPKTKVIMNSVLTLFRCAIGFAALAAIASEAAPIPGLFNTGVANNGALLASGSVDPHWRLVQSVDPAFPGPNAIVLNDSGFPIPPWLANGPASKWLAPQASQATGNQPGDYTYRITFDLAGLEPSTAVITGRWSSDNLGPEVRLNGVVTGVISDGNFGGLGNAFTINTGFIDGTNTLDFVVNNAPPNINPTGFRAELSGTAESQLPPGVPPSITAQPVSRVASPGDTVNFSAGTSGSRPLGYQWRFNGIPLPLATNALLFLTGVGYENVGGYDLVVTNAWGAATSQVATLRIILRLGPSSRRTGLVFSEIMYHPRTRTDGRNLEFIEVHNSNPFQEDLSGYRITGDADFTFPEGTIIPGDGYLVVASSAADITSVYGITNVLGGLTNNLPNEGGTLRLRKRSGGIVLAVTYADEIPWPVAADGAGHSLVLVQPTRGEADTRAWAASAAFGGSPGDADVPPAGPLENIVINELLAHTDEPFLDYVELYNRSTNTVNLSGCWLTDDPATNKYQIAGGTMLGPREFIVFTQTQLGFALSSSGEQVLLVNPTQTRVVDAIRFGGQANGVALGRFPDGAPPLRELSTRTLGVPNAPVLFREVVINEIMYHPLSGDDDDQFIELHNRGALPVNIGGWRLLDGIDFIFGAGTTIPAGGYLVVANNVSRLATNYAGLNGANLVGNFGGRLSHGGERIALAMPDYSFTTNGGAITTNEFFIVVNEVTYGDGGRWGQWSDGGGSSLELIDARSDNQQPSNWGDSDETSKAPWTTVESTGTLDHGVGNYAQLHVFLMDAGEALVDDVEVFVPPAGANRVANSNFESGFTGWTPQGTHVQSSLETNGGFNSTRSLHLRSNTRGDIEVNRVRTPLTQALSSGTATIRAKVRWLRGHPEILLRLKGNWLEAFGRLPVPANLGTPGTANSIARPNAAPAISDVLHSPALPAANQPIRVIARVQDADGVQAVTLRYRLDPSTTVSSVAMLDNGMGGDAMAGDGIYTGTIPGQPVNTLIAFRVEATDNFAPPAFAQFPVETPRRECLVRVGEILPPGAFGTYRLWMTAATLANWAQTDKQQSNEPFDCTFVYGASRVVYNVGAHYSGSPYTSPGYNSPVGNLCGYDIRFPKDELFLGSDHVVLDWPVRDDTNQREQLMFWFLEQYGLPNMYRRYVNLFVNGVKRGTIYDDLQQPGAETIEEFFPDDSEGNLYKTGCWEEFTDVGQREAGGTCTLNSLQLYTTTGGVKKTARYRWVWRPRAIDGTANDFADLFNLVDAANAPANGYQTAMESLVDIEHWTRTFAMNDLASFWDAFGNPNAKNTYLYKPDGDRWKLMCYDFDVGLGVFNDPVNDPLFPTLGDLTMNRFHAYPAFVRLYWCALKEALDTFFRTGGGSALDAVLDSKYAAFQANGISLASPAAIKTWITGRRNFLLTQLNAVSNVFNVTGNTFITTDRNLITLSGTAPVTVHTITVNGTNYMPTWLTVNTWRLQVPLTAGTNELVIAGLDRFGNAISNVTRTVEYTGADERAEDNIIINEIMYNPLVSDATFIELLNRSEAYSFDLSGWRLNGVDFTFPPGTIITNRGLLVICRDRAAFGNGYGWGIPALDGYDGQLDDGGETITLIRPGATPAEDVVVNRVTYDDDPPWLASADGLGASLQVIDPNQDNNRVSNWSDGSGWRFFSFTRGVGSSQLTNLAFFFQLPNLPGDVYIDDVSLVQGSEPAVGQNVLANPGFEEPFAPAWRVAGPATNSVIVTDLAHSGAASAHVIFVPGSLGLANFAQGFPALTANTNYTLSFWYFSGSSGTNFSFRINSLFTGGVDPRSRLFSPGEPNSGTAILPPYPLLWLSEVQPDNRSTVADNVGDNDPWVELYNGSASALSLGGYFLANDYSTLLQWAFPQDALIGPGEYLLLWADGEPGESTSTELHTNFRLNRTNGAVALSRTVNGVPQIVDYLNYRDVGTNRSYGTYPSGQASFRQVFSFPTPRGTNNPAAPPVTLFINEWMAANASFVRDPADQDFDDWFEIYNPTTNRVDLAGFTLTDDFTRPRKAVVPAGITVPAQGFLLVWADEEGGQTQPNGDLHVNFRLGQGGEQIGLYDPAGRLIDSIVFLAQTNNVSHGRWPNGGPAPFYFMPTATPRASNIIPAANPPVLSATLGANNLVTLVWSAQAGSSYRVQYKNNLNAAEWLDLGAPVSATGPTASTIDANNGSQRFYRVTLVQ
jgi:hypothetical protein